jgi:hypothetical protein
MIAPLVVFAASTAPIIEIIRRSQKPTSGAPLREQAT